MCVLYLCVCRYAILYIRMYVYAFLNLHKRRVYIWPHVCQCYIHTWDRRDTAAVAADETVFLTIRVQLALWFSGAIRLRRNHGTLASSTCEKRTSRYKKAPHVGLEHHVRLKHNPTNPRFVHETQKTSYHHRSIAKPPVRGNRGCRSPERSTNTPDGTRRQRTDLHQRQR